MRAVGHKNRPVVTRGSAVSGTCFAKGMRRVRPSDRDTVNAWYVARGMARWPDDVFPAVGFIEPGVAAGFLYQTDARGVTILEGLVTNPQANVMQRGRAARKVVEALCEEARARGLRRLVAFTETRGVEALGSSLGFRFTGTHVVLRREI